MLKPSIKPLKNKPWLATLKSTAALGLTLSVFSLSTGANIGDFIQPIAINSDNQHIDLKENTTVFNANVKVTQGTLTISADQLKAYRKGEKGQEILIATGNPVIYKQVLDNGKPIVAQANTISYDVAKRALVLSGNAQLQQNNSLVKGESIQYDLIKQTLEAKGSDNNPVESIFITDDEEKVKEQDQQTP
jgi:lipopolysaccharide export system protein LptA